MSQHNDQTEVTSSSPSDNDRTEATSSSPSDPSRPSIVRWLRVAIVAAVAMLIGLPLAGAGQMLWGEYKALRDAQAAAAASVVVGYPNISPSVSSALKPNPWFRVEGETILVWSGWKENQGHGWFRAHLGDFERSAIGDPIGRDITRAIDDPAVENGDGPIWRRIPGAAQVAGLDLDGRPCAYPMIVLGKVLIVNDTIEDRPYLVHFDPFNKTSAVAIFDPRLDGHRITMGSSGLSIKGRHVLYDRGTESLWADDGRALTAFAGTHKGKRLPLVVRARAVDWEDWSTSHPGARLLIGSLDRRPALPSE